jgi:predicted phosphoribosyltransferase
MTPTLPYRDREAAGRILAAHLTPYRGRKDVLVLALPRGGVPVGVEVAQALGTDLDILIVRKLGLPEQPELAMGAIAGGGICLRNDRVLAMSGVSREAFAQVERRERAELERRERAYRGGDAGIPVQGRCVILVDDGLATGSSMAAAIEAVKRRHPSRIVVAVPVSPAETLARLERDADEVICPATPTDFRGIGGSYVDFSQLTDDAVRAGLREFRDPGTTPSRRP